VAERLAPTSLLPSPASTWLASGLLAASVVILVSAFKALAQAHTAFDAHKPTIRLVTTGAFRFSRNPIYLSLTLLHAGVAFATDASSVLLVAVPAVALTEWSVILREARYLDSKFGAAYRSYALKVRRWF
jgi:protein-S-isoprenylcysteine O-methyltransferase Ste14